MAVGPAAQRPVILAVGTADRQGVDAGDSPRHVAAGIEFPVLVAIRAEPVTAVIVPFVGEAHRDAVFVKSPQLLDQAVVELARPFACQELNDLIAPGEKLGTVAPHTLW